MKSIVKDSQGVGDFQQHGDAHKAIMSGEGPDMLVLEMRSSVF